ncbi:hypothetical protein GCM10020331_091150 [Ectobacillus funiculus]
MINNTNVGGLTAEQAMKKIKVICIKNEVYIGKERILDEKDTKLGFTNEDLPSIKKLLEKKQRTFFSFLKDSHVYISAKQRGSVSKPDFEKKASRGEACLNESELKKLHKMRKPIWSRARSPSLKALRESNMMSPNY